MAFRLQALLDLKRRAEERAERALDEAVRSRRQVEARQDVMDADAARAEGRREAERKALAGEPLGRGVEALVRERYLERLSADERRARQQAEAHRASALTAAEGAERLALEGLAAARRAREALSKLKTKAEGEAQRLADRRADDEANDVATAARARKRDD